MKHLILVLAVALSISVKAQWLPTTTSTSTPISRQGKVTLNSINWDDHLEITRNGFGAVFKPDNSGGYLGLRIDPIGTNANVYMINGNFGIGSSAPDFRLHIKDGNGGAQLKFQRGTGIATISQDNNLNDLYIEAPAGLLLNTNGGNVGIGTTNPDFRLHIKDGSGGAQLKFQRGTGIATISQDNNLNDLYIEAPAGLLLNTNGGNVGIGTTNPDFRLHIKDGNGGAQLKFQRGTGIATISQDINLNDLYIEAPAGLLLNTNGGNVGIGTNTIPSDKLHVVGDIRLGGTARKILVGTEGIANDYWMMQDVGAGNPAIQWVQDGNAKFSIEGVTGNVGIGTTSPLARLTTSASETGTQATTKPVGKFINVGNSYSKIVLGSNNANYDGVMSMDNSSTLANTKLRLYIGNGSEATPGHSNDHFVLQGDGNVGIGTSSPDAKLAVKGTIHTQEVNVDLLGSMVPDYVFEHNYQLPSLESVKTYIDENKHLPEVPSAKEMEANGMNVGEMNLLLLKKIEELTLYVIELKRQLDAVELKQK